MPSRSANVRSLDPSILFGGVHEANEQAERAEVNQQPRLLKVEPVILVPFVGVEVQEQPDRRVEPVEPEPDDGPDCRQIMGQASYPERDHLGLSLAAINRNAK